MAAESTTDLEACLAQASALQLQACTMRVVQPLTVLAVRHLPGADMAWLDLLALPSLPQPGAWAGDPTLQLTWRSPREWLLVTTDAARGAPLTAALAPGRQPLACAVDHSAGTVTIELSGPALDELLARLMDVSAIPPAAGGATRARCADLAVTLLRLAPQRLWLLVDRALAGHLAGWLLHAASSTEMP